MKAGGNSSREGYSDQEEFVPFVLEVGWEFFQGRYSNEEECVPLNAAAFKGKIIRSYNSSLIL